MSPAALNTAREMERATALIGKLQRRGFDDFLSAVDEAVAAGAAGDAALAEVLESLPRDRKVIVAAALGDAQGSAGLSALRRVLASTSSPSGRSVGTAGARDLVCAAVLALAKRGGSDASADLAHVLSRQDPVVKEYAILGLAGAGDDRAWDEVFSRLSYVLRQAGRRPADPSPALVALCYLAGHAGGPGSPRTLALVQTVRERWANLLETERRWIGEYWPTIRPDGPAPEAVNPPDAVKIRTWVRHPLFEPSRPFGELSGP